MFIDHLVRILSKKLEYTIKFNPNELGQGFKSLLKTLINLVWIKSDENEHGKRVDLFMDQIFCAVGMLFLFSKNLQHFKPYFDEKNFHIQDGHDQMQNQGCNWSNSGDASPL
jgi:hypothetical protein